MKKHTKLLLLLVGTILFSLIVFGTSSSANGKNGLANIVSEHQTKIAKLEDLIQSLGSESNTEEHLTPEVKQTLEQELEVELYHLTKSWDTGELVEMNVTDYGFTEIDSKVVLQVYLEGEYDWGTEVVDSGKGPSLEYGKGRSLANIIISKMDEKAKLFGLDPHYEFYENGERVSFVGVE